MTLQEIGRLFHRMFAKPTDVAGGTSLGTLGTPMQHKNLINYDNVWQQITCLHAHTV